MTVHLVKLCVGADTPEDLRRWRAARAARGLDSPVWTRQTPKRAADLLDGGSLYWVFKGRILIRQRILALNTRESEGRSICEIGLGEELIATAPAPRRPFQGWRYLEPDAAPADLGGGDGADLPDDLARALKELGAW